MTEVVPVVEHEAVRADELADGARRDGAQRRVVVGDDHHRSAADRVAEPVVDLVVRELRGQYLRRGHRIVDTELGVGVGLAQRVEHLDRHRAAQVAGLGHALERHPQHADAQRLVGARTESAFGDLVADEPHGLDRLALVDQPPGRGDLELDAAGTRALHQDVRVFFQARAADEAGQRDVGAVVAELARGDHLVGADPERVAYPRHLVGEGELHVAEGVADQFDDLGGLDRGHPDQRVGEPAEHRGRTVGHGLVVGPDDLRQFAQFGQRLALQGALRAHGDVERLAAGSQDRRDDVAGGADLDRGTQQHQRTVAHVARDVAGGRLDHVDPGDTVRRQRGAHRDDVGVAREGVVEPFGGDQLARAHHPAHRIGQPGLGEVRDALVGQFDELGPGLDADHPVAGLGQHRRQRQTDVAEPDDADVVLCWTTHGSSRFSSGAPARTNVDHTVRMCVAGSRSVPRDRAAG